jgi:bacteriocin-type transport-associated protein
MNQLLAQLPQVNLQDENPDWITAIAHEATSETLELPDLERKLMGDCDFAGRFYHLLAINLSDRLRRLSNQMAKRQIKEGEPLRKVLMVFATLNDSDIAWMIANGKSEKFPPETILIKQNESVAAVYLLLDGTLGVYIGTGSEESEVARRVKGDFLGEMSFVDGGTASATVRTLDAAWILNIPQNTLAQKLQQDGGFASRFYQAIAQMLLARYQDLQVRGGLPAADDIDLLSQNVEVEDEIDFDVLEGTAIAGTRFDWLIQQLRR